MVLRGVPVGTIETAGLRGFVVTERSRIGHIWRRQRIPNWRARDDSNIRPLPSESGAILIFNDLDDLGHHWQRSLATDFCGRKVGFHRVRTRAALCWWFPDAGP